MYKIEALLGAVLAVVLAAGLSCKSNHSPDVPAVPTGPEYCFKDTTCTFRTVVNDPDGDSMVVRFDWGDSSNSHWMGWFASGETVASTHAWSDTGTYEVRVSAQDRQLTSDLSDGHLVQVAIRWPPGAPAAPAGLSVGGRDTLYSFTAGADHPDNIPVAIRFAWGDGDTSEWSEFVPSGGPVSMGHAWSAPDTYAVAAQAKDTGELTSEWSSPHTIVIRPPDTLLLWRIRLTTGYMTSSPAIAPDGTIYVGASDGGLYAVEPRYVVRWRYPTGGAIQSSPAIAPDGTIYVGSNDSCLYAVNPNGTLKWKYVTGRSIQSSPAIAADGTVYFGAGGDGLYAMRPDGTVKWNYVITGAAVNTSPAVAADGTVYFGTDGSSVYAMNPDGTERWSHVSGIGGAFASPAIGADGAIYCGARSDWEGEGCLFSFNPDGSLRWSFPGVGGIGSSPAIGTDGTVYGVAKGWFWGSSCLFALNGDGSPKWFLESRGAAGNSSPALSSFGTVYFGELGLHAAYPDGTSKWLYESGGDIESSPTIGPDGTVYFTSTDGYLYALKGTSPLADSPWPKFRHDLSNTGRSDEGGWTGLRMIGASMLAPDSSGFLIRVVNDGTAEDTVNWLVFYDTPDSAYMRDFTIDAIHGIGYPLPHGQNGTGRGDTVGFAPVTIAPYGTQSAELCFVDFYLDEDGEQDRANVSGKVFVFRFSDGSVIVARP